MTALLVISLAMLATVAFVLVTTIADTISGKGTWMLAIIVAVFLLSTPVVTLCLLYSKLP